MNKQTIELTIPEGFEVAEGEQPRVAKIGELYLAYDCMGITKAKRSHGCAKSIILKKKEPVYKVCKNGFGQVESVEIKALEDALSIINKYGFDMEDRHAVNALKELIS